MSHRIRFRTLRTTLGTAALCTATTSALAHVGATPHAHPHGVSDGSFAIEVVVGLIIASTVLGAGIGIVAARNQAKRDDV